MDYTRYEIRKKSGGVRVIYAPNKELKLKLRGILSNLEDSCGKDISVLAHGFVKERNCKTNAQKHSGKKYVVNMDIKDFFPSCRANYFYTLVVSQIDKTKFIHQGVDQQTTGTRLFDNVFRYCFIDGSLPQGFPASPFLANLYLSKFDRVAVSVLRKHVSSDIIYTRYADDITVSSDSRAVEKAVEVIDKILTSYGFELNSNKTKFMHRGMRQEITGLNVNSGKVTIGKEYRRKIRAIIHRAKDCGWIITKGQKQTVEGMIGHVALCHPKEAGRYREMLREVKTVDKMPGRLIGKEIVRVKAKGKIKAVKRGSCNTEGGNTEGGCGGNGISRRITI